MATQWTEPMRWDAAGSEPSENLKTNGFKAGDKPPASVFNYFLNKMGVCLTELQNAANQIENDKVDKVDGKGLSANDYTDEEKAYIDSLIGTLFKLAGGGLAWGYEYNSAAAGSLAKGFCCYAAGSNSFASGANVTASGYNSFASGANVTASASSAFASGMNATASHTGSAAIGTGVKSMIENGTVLGKYNNTAEGYEGLLIVGNGTADDARTNVFRITTAGKCTGVATFMPSGADYAEYYEWADGNPNDEDRRGYFVTLDGNKIRKANADDDYILGVISATPSIVGNTHSENWKGMYLTDVFGERLTEVVEVPETIIEGTDEVIPAHTEIRPIINPEYDSTKPYAGRDKRAEWDAVGTHGQLVVLDDGSCEINGYCAVADNGAATKADGKTEYRVIERLDDNHIRIVIK